MRIICCTMVFTGAIIMVLSAIAYYRLLLFIKEKTASTSIFADWMYLAGFLMLVFFCVGYLVVGIQLLTQPIYRDQLLISMVFLIGAVFAYIMVSLEKTISRSLFDKTGEIVRTLVNAMETKDKYTRGHSDHVLNITRLLYNNLPDQIKEQINLSQLMDAAILHDIGKIGIEDHILNKTGPLTPEEWEIIRQHPNLGKEILKNTSYQEVGDIIRMHHERIDGKGYYGIPGHVIPLESRVIAVADTFSALYTNRIYRSKQDFLHAMDTLKSAAGTQLDAGLVEIFATLPKEDLDAAGYIFSEQISYVR